MGSLLPGIEFFSSLTLSGDLIHPEANHSTKSVTALLSQREEFGGSELPFKEVSTPGN